MENALKMYFLSNLGIFHGYVSLPEGIFISQAHLFPKNTWMNPPKKPNPPWKPRFLGWSNLSFETRCIFEKIRFDANGLSCGWWVGLRLWWVGLSWLSCGWVGLWLSWGWVILFDKMVSKIDSLRYKSRVVSWYVGEGWWVSSLTCSNQKRVRVGPRNWSSLDLYDNKI